MPRGSGLRNLSRFRTRRPPALGAAGYGAAGCGAAGYGAAGYGAAG